MATKVTVYQCDYCKKKVSSKSYCKKHEKRCFGNPVVRACRTCENANYFLGYDIDDEGFPAIEVFARTPQRCDHHKRYFKHDMQKRDDVCTMKMQTYCVHWRQRVGE